MKTITYKGKKYTSMPKRYFITGSGVEDPYFNLMGQASPNIPHGYREIQQQEAMKLAQAKLGTKGLTSGFKTAMQGIIAGKGEEYFKNIAGIGSYVPYSTVKKQQGVEEKVARGEMINIGTAEAPLYVPSGSPAQQLAQKKTQPATIMTKSTQQLIQGTPGSSNEYDQWVKQGRVFKNGQWYEGASPQVSPQVSEAMETNIADITKKVGALSQEIDTSLAPSLGTGADDVIATGNGDISSFQDYFDKAQKDYEDRMEKLDAEKKTADTSSKGVLDFFKKQSDDRADIRKDQKSSQEMYRETLEEYGLTPESVTKVKGYIGQLATYNQQMIDLESQKQMAIGQTEQMGMPVTYIRGEKALIERQYNSKIAAKAAQAGVVSQQIQMERGMWDEARTTANQIVELALYDQKQELADLQWAQDTYVDLYNIMGKEEKEAWDRKYTLAQDTYNDAKDSLNNVMNLMLEYPAAGIGIKDTVAEATQKAMDWDKAQPKEEKEYADPMSYREWELAGGEAGTGQTYAEFISKEKAEGLTATQRKELANYLEDVGSYTTREEAITDLQSKSTSILVRVGDTGYNLILAEVDRLFPAPIPPEPPAPAVVTPGGQGVINPETGEIEFEKPEEEEKEKKEKKPGEELTVGVTPEGKLTNQGFFNTLFGF